MTASATITIEQKENVVTVPNRAVQRQGREQFVNVVLPDGKTTERRVVTTGLVNDTNTEITDGLAEGESVMLPTTTTRAPAVGGAGGLTGGGGATFVTKP
jgi:multidrug efflux pump subunit AcrA (membrane-fusion protein)